MTLALEQGPEACELEVELRRRAGASDAAASVVEYTPANIYLGLGLGLRQAGEHGARTAWRARSSLAWHRWVRHGFYAHTLLETYADGSGQAVARDVPAAHFSDGIFSAGYAYRRRIIGPLNLGYRIGPGLAFARVDDEAAPIQSTAGLGLTQSFHLALSWLTGLAGFDDAPMGFGAAGYHLYAPGAELAGLPVDAHRFGALLLFNMGG